MIMRHYASVPIEHLSMKNFQAVTETSISSALQIPTFWAANTAPRDKVWRREKWKTTEEM